MKKSAQVVMLPTNEKAEIGFLTQKGKERGHLVHFDRPMPNILDSENQHLYFLSDEEIKEGDYVIEDIGGVVYGPIDRESIVENPKKIIATTDTSLRLTEIVKEDDSIEFPYITSLPQPSQSFIQKFVEEYNKGNVITEVLVEYEVDDGYMEVKSYLKVNSKDNTITIRKAKDSWSREEVIELLHRRMEYTFGGDYDKSTTDKWIEENL